MIPSEIVQLHKSELSAGLLPLFGVGFLTRLYELAGRCPWAILLTSENGFLLGTIDTPSFYRWMIPRLLPTLALALIREPSLIGRATSVGTGATTKCAAQLLSIAVRPGARGAGEASELLRQFRACLSYSNIERFSVIAAETQGPALAFYQKHGGTVVSRPVLGGLPSREFVLTT